MTPPVISHRFPYVPLRVEVGDRTYAVDALVDTGFDGGVVVPAGLITNVAPNGLSGWRLAGGSAIKVPLYSGRAHVGHLPPIEVEVIALGEEALVGRDLTDQFKVTLDHGRQLVIEP